MAAGVKVQVKRSGRFKGPDLSDPSLKRIGEEMVEAQLARWKKGLNADGNAAKKLSVKYAIIKGAYLRKKGDPRGNKRVFRDMNMTGLMVKNFSLRKAAGNRIRAENTTRAARAHASQGNKYDQMIGFAPSDAEVIDKAAKREYGAYLKQMWVPT